MVDCVDGRLGCADSTIGEARTRDGGININEWIEVVQQLGIMRKFERGSERRKGGERRGGDTHFWPCNSREVSRCKMSMCWCSYRKALGLNMHLKLRPWMSTVLFLGPHHNLFASTYKQCSSSAHVWLVQEERPRRVLPPLQGGTKPRTSALWWCVWTLLLAEWLPANTNLRTNIGMH